VSLIKAGLRLRGLPVGSVRPPLVDPTPEQEVRLGAILESGLALAERLAPTVAPPDAAAAAAPDSTRVAAAR
jgi:5-dehydro-4-deoxyglucarate dehydratase